MKKYWIITALSLFVIVMSVIVIRTTSVQAIEGLKPSPLSGTPPPIKRLLGEPDRKLLASPGGSMNGKGEAIKAKLTANKLKICEAKSKNIVKRSEQLGKMVVNMEEKFAAILKGVKDYYVKKGLTVANYEELLATIETKKGTVDSLLVVAQTDITNFSCTGENPAEQLKKFHTDMQEVLDALKEYRTSIKDLIVAIHGVSKPLEGQSTTTATPSAIPTSSL